MRTFTYTLFFLFICYNVSGQTKKPVHPVTKITTKTKTKTKTVTKTTPKPAIKQEPQVLIVKIKSMIFKNMVGAFGVRERIEDNIEEQLDITKNGEWISGDSAPGEANILFKVKNVDQAIKSILQVLDKENFDKTIVIGIRNPTVTQTNWTYKIVYPPNYKGTI